MPRKRSCHCGECPKCKNADYSKAWYHRNKDRVKQYNTEESGYRAGRAKLFRQYGITMEEFDSMYVEQRGLCKICGNPETVLGSGGKVKTLAIDHDHETGQVRGLLCNNCNRAIGLLKDNADLLRTAADYLDGFSF